ncbi:MAG: hypothetical protein HY685_02930 [Chloroflexi bacterium]|nr:hypothetical protein [Chloroflexota bacterium]
MVTGVKGRITWLLVAAALVGGAVVVRVWLAATGGYSGSPFAVPLRLGSAVALFLGLALAGLVVAWPMKGPGRPEDRENQSKIPKTKSAGGI